jgi:hypothetical protein
LVQRNRVSWASHQKSITLRPQPGGEATKSIRDMWWYRGKSILIYCDARSTKHYESHHQTVHRALRTYLQHVTNKCTIYEYLTFSVPN